MELWFKLTTGYLASFVEAGAALIIACAALQAFLHAIFLFLRHLAVQEIEAEHIRLRLGRWLALALEFELGADILRTAISPTWSEIGQLAAIATIRTLLNYFLQMEIDRASSRYPRTPNQPPA